MRQNRREIIKKAVVSITAVLGTYVAGAGLIAGASEGNSNFLEGQYLNSGSFEDSKQDFQQEVETLNFDLAEDPIAYDIESNGFWNSNGITFSVEVPVLFSSEDEKYDSAVKNIFGEMIEHFGNPDRENYRPLEENGYNLTTYSLTLSATDGDEEFRVERPTFRDIYFGLEEAPTDERAARAFEKYQQR